jgi:2-phosphosulfolactate phosphatase
MEFRRVLLEACETATDTVIVIDVVRAFSTAAYAFAAGASSIALVSTVDEALALRRRWPDALTMGEVGGLPIAAFDFGNSPTGFDQEALAHRRLIQRTSNGTQGIIRSRQASHLLAASLCCARATAQFIQRLDPRTVTFVITGQGPEIDGDEDIACADYIEALLCGRAIDQAEIIRRVYASTAGRHFTDPNQPEFPLADLEYCTQVDRFDFAMPVQRHEDWLELQAQRPQRSAFG